MDMLIDRWAWHVVRVVNRLDDLRNKVKARGNKKNRRKSKNFTITKKNAAFGTSERSSRKLEFQPQNEACT